jgi:ABC-type proline/glycine betaine transport system permease subunit
MVWTQAVLSATPAELTREFSSAIGHHEWLHAGSIMAAFVVGVLVGTYGLILLVR